jgi:hypothetical protein
MGFVTTDGSGAVKFDEIVRHWVQADLIYFTTKRGETFKATKQNWDLAYFRETTSVVPAQPSTYFLEWSEQEDGSYSWQRAVVLAWGLGFDGYLVPIGADGIDEMSRAVLHPSGLVTKGLQGEWGSFEEFTAWAKEYGDSKN